MTLNILQGGETMTLVLRKPISTGQCVQVTVGEDETLLIDTKTLNPYCFTFKAPRKSVFTIQCSAIQYNTLYLALNMQGF